MTKLTPAIIWETLDCTWPAATTKEAGGFIIRDGQGGGKRVSAATLGVPIERADIDKAEQANKSLNQPYLFMIRGEDTNLDSALAARGYDIVDPVAVYAASVSDLQGIVPPLMVFDIWEPLAIQRDLWTEAGIGPARLAVMERVQGPRTTLFGRIENRPAGTAFVALHGPVAMLHALEVHPNVRRRGLARNMMHAAANWAAETGADTLALAVTKANVPANRLYSSLGMSVVEQYHYRMKNEAPT